MEVFFFGFHLLSLAFTFVLGPICTGAKTSWDEFRPKMIKFLFYMSVFILGSQYESHPAQVEFLLPVSSQTLFMHGTFIPRRPFTQHFLPCFIPEWHFILVPRTGMKSSQDEVIPGQNHVNSHMKMTRYWRRWIHSGKKDILGQKLSCVNRPLVKILYLHWHLDSREGGGFSCIWGSTEERQGW